jgi:hypothetical protein
MEIASNSPKHVFQRDLGSHFDVELQVMAVHEPVLLPMALMSRKSAHLVVGTPREEAVIRIELLVMLADRLTPVRRAAPLRL